MNATSKKFRVEYDILTRTGFRPMPAKNFTSPSAVSRWRNSNPVNVIRITEVNG
jgi:hypothetical protein